MYYLNNFFTGLKHETKIKIIRKSYNMNETRTVFLI